MSQPTSSDVPTKACSTCLGMFANPLRSNQVICRPDFGVAKVTDGSESGFEQKAGGVTINTALGVVCQTIPGHLPLCMSSCCASCTPSSVSNHRRRKRDVEQRKRRGRKRWKWWCHSQLFQHSTFLNSSVSTFSRCIQMLLVMCNPLQVRVGMHDKE